MSGRAHPDVNPVTDGGDLPIKSSPHRHKVGVPPKQNMFHDFMYTFKETFFHDDPLRHFKDQPKSKKFMLGLQSVFPVFDWGRNYNLKKFRGDLTAGLTIASLCIPQVKRTNLSCTIYLCHKKPIFLLCISCIFYDDFRILDMLSLRTWILNTVYVSLMI